MPESRRIADGLTDGLGVNARKRVAKAVSEAERAGGQMAKEKTRALQALASWSRRGSICRPGEAAC